MGDIYQMCDKCGNIFISTASSICPSCGYQIKYFPTYISNTSNISATHRPVPAFPCIPIYNININIKGGGEDMKKYYTVVPSLDGPIKFKTKEKFEEYMEENHGNAIISAADKIYVLLNTYGDIGLDCVYKSKSDIIEKIWDLIDSLAKSYDGFVCSVSIETGSIQVSWDEELGFQIYFNLQV